MHLKARGLKRVQNSRDGGKCKRVGKRFRRRLIVPDRHQRTHDRANGHVRFQAFGELNQGLSIPEVSERINRHFGVRRPTPMQIDEFAADIPLAPEPASPAGRATEKAGHT